jgi:hypothetical protein
LFTLVINIVVFICNIDFEAVASYRFFIGYWI